MTEGPGIGAGNDNASEVLHHSNRRHENTVTKLADGYDDTPITVEWLQKQLAYAEREEKEEMMKVGPGGGDANDEPHRRLEDDIGTSQALKEKSDVDPAEWLKSKRKELSDISLVHDYFSTMSIVVDDECKDDKIRPKLSFLVKKCLDLGSFILSRSEMNTASTNSKVFAEIQKQHLNLWQHVSHLLQTNLLSCLEKLNYPTTAGCNTIIQTASTSVISEDYYGVETNDDNVTVNTQHTTKALLLLVHYMEQLRTQQSQFSLINNPTIQQKLYLVDIWDELFKPIVHRVCFHFITSTNKTMNEKKNLDGNKNSSNENMLEKLPSSLYQYLRDFLPPILTSWLSLHSYILQKSTSNAATNSSSSIIITHFQKRIVQLVMHVYKYFQLFTATTPHDNLSNGNRKMHKNMAAHSLARILEQTLYFDKFLLQELTLLVNDHQIIFTSTGGVTNAILQKHPSILTWWIHVENKNALFKSKSVLQPNHDGDQTRNNIDTRLLSPTVELFVSLWNSMKQKSSLLSSTDIRRRFFTQVALPTCQSLIDTLHQEATSLKHSLLPKKRGSLLPCDKILYDNIQLWLNIITSTHVASLTILLDNDSNDQYYEFQHELKPIGTSLENLRDAMLEDLCSLIVETLLIERAKLASYQMKCAHMLTQHRDDEDVNDDDDKLVPVKNIQLSPDLFETAQVLEIVINSCRDYHDKKFPPLSLSSASTMNENQSKRNDWVQKVIKYAPNKLWMNIGKMVQEKFLEIALDVHDMIPKLKGNGAKQFLFDVQYMATHVLPPSPYVREPSQQLWDRVLEIATFMAISNSEMTSLFKTWQTLFYDPSKLQENDDVNNDGKEETYLDIHFTDESLICQAESMLRAKGYKQMTFTDAVCIMNKRLYDYSR